MTNERVGYTGSGELGGLHNKPCIAHQSAQPPCSHSCCIACSWCAAPAAAALPGAAAAPPRVPSPRACCRSHCCVSTNSRSWSSSRCVGCAVPPAALPLAWPSPPAAPLLLGTSSSALHSHADNLGEAVRARSNIKQGIAVLAGCQLSPCLLSWRQTLATCTPLVSTPRFVPACCHHSQLRAVVSDDT
jgi:hypothetical protein